MPTPIPPNPDLGLLNYIDDLVKIISPLVLAIVSLALWAFRKQEKTQDQMQAALEAHIKEDDGIHDKLFTSQRQTERELAELIGEHRGAGHKKETP